MGQHGVESPDGHPHISEINDMIRRQVERCRVLDKSEHNPFVNAGPGELNNLQGRVGQSRCRVCGFRSGQGSREQIAGVRGGLHRMKPHIRSNHDQPRKLHL